MVTMTSMPAATVAQRSSIQRTFVPATVLAGFTDPQHFQILAGDHLAEVDGAERARLLAESEACRAIVSTLPSFNPLGPLVLRPITGPHVDSITADPVFQLHFGTRPWQFAYVDLRNLIALQPWVEPRNDAVPANEPELLDFALPRNWEVAAELSFSPPAGPIQVLSSDPALSGLQMELDAANARVILSPPKHPNLIQVVEFGGRAYLRNGYHRVVDALAAGRTELPAIVLQGFLPQDVELPGIGMFTMGYVMNLGRPPLLTDFASPAAMTTKVRERRYAVVVSFDAKRLAIGI